jgi:phospholipid/cholesterol/gamma-HCH transport system ATP-binding protein
MSEAAVRLSGVKKAYRRPVLEDVSLVVPRGALYAIIGPGASGKSVLLRLIAGLVNPDAGEIETLGVRVDRATDLELLAVRRRIGMLFQNYALFDFMTVGENVGFPLRRLHDTPATELAERVAERLSRVSLPGIEGREPGSLSGGQKKRVGIARATITRPELVLYDDPTAGLDPVTSQKIWELLLDEKRTTGATAIVISSDVTGVLSIAERVGMLHRGRLVFDGTVEDAKTTEDALVKQFVHGLVEGPL